MSSSTGVTTAWSRTRGTTTAWARSGASCPSTSSGRPWAVRSRRTRSSSSPTTRPSSGTCRARRRQVSPRGVAPGRLLGGGRGHRRSVTGQPSPATSSPEDRFRPVAKAVLGNTYLYPLPTLPGATNDLIVLTSDKKRAHQGDLEGRRRPVGQGSAFRPLLDQKYEAAPDRAALPSVSVVTGDAPFKSAAFNWTHPLGRHSLNELLLGYARPSPRAAPRTGPASETRTRPSGYPVARPSPALARSPWAWWASATAGSTTSTTSRPSR